MSGRLLAIVAAIAGALIALALVGVRVLERDRQQMYERYAHDRSKGLEEAARRFDKYVTDIGEDLDLASSLLGDAESARVAERELDAIATIKREYLVMEARGSNADLTRVIAFDAPSEVAPLATATLDRMLDVASAQPQQLHVSAAVAPGVLPPWYRVFAKRPVSDSPPVVALVDMSVLLARLDLQRNPNSRVLIICPDGVVAPSSDARFTEVAAREDWLTDGIDMKTIDSDLAAEIGLPHTTAVVAAVPLRIDDGQAWKLVEVSSTTVLASQQHVLVRRVVVGASLVLLMLLSAGAYVIYNARRAATLRERLRNADRLAHLTEKAEKILDHIPSGVLAVSDDGLVTAANRRFIQRFADVSGSRLEEAFSAAPREDVEALSQLFSLAIKTRMAQSLHRAQFRALGPDAVFSIHVVPLERAVRDVSALVVFDDVTGMRRYEDRILRSEKLVTAGQLAAGIAHEIGTPLNVARGRLEMIVSHLGKDHVETPNHQVVIDQIDRVTRLIQQLLDYVRPAPSALQHVDISRMLRGVGELLSAQANNRHVAIRVQAPDEMPALRADPDQVQQIVVNLVLNAIDACAEGGHIVLEAKAEGPQTVIEVVDDGQGIPPQAQAQVFDPFFTTKKRGQGTGLGLWVVAQLVRANCGEIELSSEPGKGTKVRVTWPVAA